MRGGVFALLTTNSDDLGLGLPVMGALFKPELVQMCHVERDGDGLQPGDLHALRHRERADAAASGKLPPPTKALVLSVLRGQTKNPLNIAVVSGLLNLLLGGGCGCPLPFFLESLRHDGRRVRADRPLRRRAQRRRLRAALSVTRP